ncbi:MAG: hypothetical protein RIC19_10450 [Phaeodactylibacter sp.]|uniref:hypothetical protein n=1 Tax=Phaeodactylibacter sp. TaxID=1940289 RepID=UPI0032EB2048
MVILFSFLLSCSLFIAGDAVPPKVKDAFSRQYIDVPEAAVTWGVEEEDFVATFLDARDRLAKAFFSSEGEWEETHIRLYPSGLPRPVRLYYEANHEEKDVSFMGRVQYADGNESYRIEWETYEAVHIEEISPEGALLDVKQLSFTEGLDVW